MNILRLSACACLFVGIGSCLYDADARCSPGQEYIAGFCVCLPGHVPSSEQGGCVPCGENEIPLNGQCQCSVGFAKPFEGGTCIATALGAECSAALPCADPQFSACHIESGDSGYCTTEGCSSSADCSGGYACDTSVLPTYCKRPPQGQGNTCEDDNDCTGNEASVCDVFGHRCLVSGCTLDDASSCFIGWTCCDVTGLGSPDLPDTLCVTPTDADQLEPYGAVCATP